MSKRTERESWFFDRIGSIVFRSKSESEDESIQSFIEAGVKIKDEGHAMYLHDLEFQTEKINFFESKENRDSISAGN